MNQTIICLVLLLLHIICCVLIYLGIWGHILKVRKHLILLAVFLPLWGPLCILGLHFQILFSGTDVHRADVEKMRINEEIYRSILTEGTETQKEIVPLEEALLINNPRLRRNLIMDILNDHPDQYMELLHQARMNEDVEVVHYAATAMAELSKEYDFRLQKLEEAYVRDPKDKEILARYCDFLGEYIKQNMIKGSMELVQRNQYSALLQKKLEAGADYDTCVLLAGNQLVLKDYSGALKTLGIMKEKWPRRDMYWMLSLRFHAQQNQGDAIRELEEEIERRHIYLSAEGREALAFWRQNREKRAGTF